MFHYHCLKSCGFEFGGIWFYHLVGNSNCVWNAMLKEAAYKELLANCSKWNSRIGSERRNRNPFLDAQTGVAQRPSAHLYRSVSERLDVDDPDVAYQYPARRWKKRRRSPHEPEPTMLTGAEDSCSRNNAPLLGCLFFYPKLNKTVWNWGLYWSLY